MFDRFAGFLVAPRRASLLYALAGSIGLTVAWYLLGWSGIHGTSEYWTTTHNDSLQGIAALRYYVNEPWTWPILDVASYGYPAGTNLILSDSIPLLAVPTKLLSGLLPADFHYFGYWMAFCFVAQAIAMVALFRTLRWHNLLAVVTATSIGLLQTVLLARFFHAALMAQFVIIVALILGTRGVRGIAPRRQMVLLFGLSFVVFFIHLYLFVMVLVLAAGFCAQFAHLGRVRWISVGMWAGAAAVVTAVFVIGNDLLDSAGADTGGFGYYSLNLLAPLRGNIDATGGQYEGYSYMGLGAIALIAVGVVLARDQLRRILRSYWIPLSLAALLAAFALSTTVWVGTSWDLELPGFGIVDWLGGRFRSSGRFVWPLVYVSIGAAIYLSYRSLRTRQAVALLLAASLLQIADLGGLAGDVSGILQRGEEVYVPTEEWRAAVAAHDLVTVSQQECVVGLGVVALANREVQRIAALEHVRVSAAAVARQEVGCADPTYDQPLIAGELRIAWAAVYPSYELAGANCARFDLGTVCSAEPGFDLGPLGTRIPAGG